MNREEPGLIFRPGFFREWGPGLLRQPGLCVFSLMKINWKEVCKFLAAAFFCECRNPFLSHQRASAGVRHNFVVAPEVNGMRSIAHFVFFVICFYLGFIRN